MENTEKSDNKNYEISFLVKTEEGPAVVLRLLKQHQFDIILEGPIRKINLAYKIKKETQGYFGFFHVSGSPESLPAVNHDLSINPEILRFLFITPPFAKSFAKSKEQAPAKPRISRPLAAKVEPEVKPSVPLSNEALERKIEEILQ